MKAEQTLAIADRRAKVLTYFAEHPRATYRDAARDLSITLSTIKRDHDAAITDIVSRAADAYMAAMIARNEAIVQAFLPLALIRGSVPHAQAILAADKRTADLLGLDSPKRVEGRHMVEIRSLAEKVAADLGLNAADVLAEADRILAEAH